MIGHYPAGMTVRDLEPVTIEWPVQHEPQYFCKVCEIATGTSDECPICNRECVEVDDGR